MDIYAWFKGLLCLWKTHQEYQAKKPLNRPQKSILPPHLSFKEVFKQTHQKLIDSDVLGHLLSCPYCASLAVAGAPNAEKMLKILERSMNFYDPGILLDILKDKTNPDIAKIGALFWLTRLHYKGYWTDELMIELGRIREDLPESDPVRYMTDVALNPGFYI